MTKKTILHVEDDDPAAYLLRAALEEAGITVAVFRVCDGEAALEFLHCKDPYHNAPRPDLIVLDIKLPRMSGWEVLQAIQSNETLRSIPIVVFTHLTYPQDEHRALGFGVEEYIKKPFLDFEMLIIHLKRACSRLLDPLS